MKEVLIVIPAYNEEASIGALLDDLEKSDIKEFADVLVVNDASADKTSWISRRHNVAVISHVFNLGYGSALQLGYKYAVRRGYRYAIQLDADGQHDISNVTKIYDHLRKTDAQGHYPDIVIGSRFCKGSESFPISSVKMAAIKLFRWIIRRASGKIILDPTSGLQGLSRRAFLYYSMFQNFDYVYPDANMIIQMIMLGFRVVEIPSVMHARETGVSMHSGFLNPLFYMMIMPLSVFSIYFRVKRGLQKQVKLYKD